MEKYATLEFRARSVPVWQKKYSSFVQFTAKSKGDITPKQYAYYSALSNLNFDRYDVTQY